MIVNVNIDMEINSGDDDKVIIGVDSHQDGVVGDVIQEWDKVANPDNGNDVIEHSFAVQDPIGQSELADLN